MKKKSINKLDVQATQSTYPSWEQEQKDLNEIFAKAGIMVQVTKGKLNKESKQVTFLVKPKDKT